MRLVIIFSLCLIQYGSMKGGRMLSIKCIQEDLNEKIPSEKKQKCKFDANKKPYCEMYVSGDEYVQWNFYKDCGKSEKHFIPYDYCMSKRYINI